MNFVDAVKSGYRNYATFSGRASRSAFWWWVLFQILADILIAILFGGGHMMRGPGEMGFNYEGGLIANLWSLANLLPGLAVAARRLHDVDKSAWWLLIGLIPVIGWIVLIVWYAQKSDSGANRFGPAPDIGTSA